MSCSPWVMVPLCYQTLHCLAIATRMLVFCCRLFTEGTSCLLDALWMSVNRSLYKQCFLFESVHELEEVLLQYSACRVLKKNNFTWCLAASKNCCISIHANFGGEKHKISCIFFPRVQIVSLYGTLNNAYTYAYAYASSTYTLDSVLIGYQFGHIISSCLFTGCEESSPAFMSKYNK